MKPRTGTKKHEAENETAFAPTVRKLERQAALKAEIARGLTRKDAPEIARRIGVSVYWVQMNWSACAGDVVALKIGRASWRTLRARMDAAQASGQLIYEKWEASLTPEARRSLNLKFWEHCVRRGIAAEALGEANAMREFWALPKWTLRDARAGRVPAGALRSALRAAIYARARLKIGRSIGVEKAVHARASAEFERLGI